MDSNISLLEMLPADRDSGAWSPAPTHGGANGAGAFASECPTDSVTTQLRLTAETASRRYTGR